MTVREPSTRQPLWIAVIAVAAIGAWFALPAGRQLTMRFLGSLRMDKPQTLNVNLSEFVGPNAS